MSSGPGQVYLSHEKRRQFLDLGIEERADYRYPEENRT
jgi:hypothetical protein